MIVLHVFWLAGGDAASQLENTPENHWKLIWILRLNFMVIQVSEGLHYSIP